MFHSCEANEPFLVLIYSDTNTSGNWVDEKLCGNTTCAERNVFTQFQDLRRIQFPVSENYGIPNSVKPITLPVSIASRPSRPEVKIWIKLFKAQFMKIFWNVEYSSIKRSIKFRRLLRRCLKKLILPNTSFSVITLLLTVLKNNRNSYHRVQVALVIPDMTMQHLFPESPKLAQ